MATLEKYVIIVAGGKGERMAAGIPKQFILLSGQPILMHTIRAFHTYDSQMHIILVLPEHHQKTWTDLCEKYHFTINHQVVAGGETRFHSVKNALAHVPSQVLVGIHDGVRPLVSREVIRKCYETALENPAVIPVFPVIESIREVDASGEKSRPVDRNLFRIVQTPQVFQSEYLLKAYNVPYDPLFTDDASVVERITPVCMVNGNRENIKITTPEDLIMAEAFYALSR